MDHKHLERIGKLLRQAEKAGTEDEATTFMKKAQELSTRHAIDLEVARQHQADKTARKVPIVRQITIGERGKRLLATYCELYMAIARANDVTCDVAHNSTYVIAYGFESDVDVVDALYASLAVQMVEASSAYLRKGDYKHAEEVWDWTSMTMKSVSGITARKSFQEAFASRIGTRLYFARQEAVEEAEAIRKAEIAAHELDESEPGTELVLRTKELEIKDFYKANTKARGSWRGGRSSTKHSSHASDAGRRAGSKARLGGQQSIGGGSRSIGA